MSILHNLRSYSYRRALRKRLEQQKRHNQGKQPVNLATAKRIGIVFDATELPEREVAVSFAKRLKKDNKQVRMLGYFQTDVGEADFAFPYFTKKDIAWAGYPKGNEVEHFMEQSYDLLLVLQVRSNLLVEYLACLADANMKVGPITDNEQAYDLLLDIPADAPLPKFITQLENILAKTNVAQPAHV